MENIKHSTQEIELTGKVIVELATYPQLLILDNLITSIKHIAERGDLFYKFDETFAEMRETLESVGEKRARLNALLSDVENNLLIYEKDKSSALKRQYLINAYNDFHNALVSSYLESDTWRLNLEQADGKNY